MAKHRVARLSDVPPGSLTRCDAEGTAICLVRTADGRTYAVADTCPHEEASLSEGFLEGVELECPWHSSLFDVRTGDVLGPPATEALRTYPVELKGDEIWVTR